MKVHREFTLATSCAAMLAANLSGPVFAAAFMKLGDIKGKSDNYLLRLNATQRLTGSINARVQKLTHPSPCNVINLSVSQR